MADEIIVEKDIHDLARCIEINRGHFAFLIGAGTSKAAGIPTANELIKRWQKEKYPGSEENPEDSEEFQSWVKKKEEEMDENDSQYGFWFEQCYPTGAGRRSFIQNLVEDKEPAFGTIVLAAMMAQDYVPVTQTPNFDDLLYDAFYLFLENKPLVINHDALAPQFRLTEERPTIIKLHGDYLYDNLQNTTVETERLEKNMERALRRSLEEYGLVVVGYGGNDNSIMGVLKKLDIPNYGLWWCVLEDSGQESLSQEARDLLQGPNRFLVKIPGAEELFTTLWREIKIRTPRPREIKDRAEIRANMLDKKIEERKGKATGEEKQALENLTTVYKAFEKGFELSKNEKYREAINAYGKAIELDPEYAMAYYNRGYCYSELGEYERAIEDYDKTIELNPEYAKAYHNRGYCYDELGEHERAIEDYDKVIELDPEDAKAYYNRGYCYDELGEHEQAIEDYDKVIELDPEDAKAYLNHGNTYGHLEEYERAIEDYDKAIELNPEYTKAYLNRAEALLIIGKPTEALKDAQEALKLSEEKDDSAESLMLLIIAKILLGEEITEEEEYKKICSQEFTTTWSFKELDSWLETADISKENKDYIQEIIDLLREHKD